MWLLSCGYIVAVLASKVLEYSCMGILGSYYAIASVLQVVAKELQCG